MDGDKDFIKLSLTLFEFACSPLSFDPRQPPTMDVKGILEWFAFFEGLALLLVSFVLLFFPLRFQEKQGQARIAFLEPFHTLFCRSALFEVLFNQL